MARLTFTLQEAAAAAGGRILAGPPSLALSGLRLDSRSCFEGCLFAALKGSRSDGHDYLEDARRRGAAAALVERELPLPSGLAALRVPSVEGAVQALGRMARRAFQGEVAAVVGSCGKTTTKEMAAALLRRLGPVHATSGNRNNLLGLPETLLDGDLSARFWVLELGISHPGEMESLAPLAAPTAVLFTTIQKVHLEYFPSLEAIRDEKARVLRHAAPGSLAVLNADDPLLAGLPLPEGFRRAAYGLSPGADLRVLPKEKPSASGVPFVLEGKGQRAEGLLPLLGSHNLLNFAGAACLAAEYGLPLGEAAAAAAELRPFAHRGERFWLEPGILVLDDSYNSNPAALASALGTLRTLDRRPLAVLGEMLELGPEGAELHREAGRRAAEAGVQALLCVGGENAAEMARAFAPGGGEVLHVPAWPEGLPWIEARLSAGDVLLVKGSRGVGLDGLVRALREGRGS
ncbi:MAG: UDP-N-acetylmuramoyl-tripeptide--D-alanyl-D-alanine ligase [Acidobacteriota bacterium]